MAIAYRFPRYEYAAVQVADAVYLVAGTGKSDGRKAGPGASTRPSPRSRGARIEGAVFRHPSWSAIRWVSWRPRDSGARHRGRCTPLRDTARKTMSSAEVNGIATYCPVDGAGRFFRRKVRPESCPTNCWARRCGKATRSSWRCCKSRRAGGDAEDRPARNPHCWRCHHPTIFRATEQWFIGMEVNRNLRENALAAIKRVKWNPAWGEERIRQHDRERPDWCISRQRAWGVPIIVFYCDGCQEPLTDRKILDRVVDADSPTTRRTSGIRTDGGGARDRGRSARLRRHGPSARKATSRRLVRFGREPSGGADAGESICRGRRICISRAAISIAAGSTVPSDCGRPARRGALSRVGYQRLDAGWRRHALSKSQGPRRKSRRSSTDTARTCCVCGPRRWISPRTCDSPTIVSRLIEAYRKLRNTFRYTLGNLHDFDPETDAVPVKRAAGDRPLDPVAGRGLVRRTRVFTTKTRSTRSIARSTISRPRI